MCIYAFVYTRGDRYQCINKKNSQYMTRQSVCGGNQVRQNPESNTETDQVCEAIGVQ